MSTDEKTKPDNDPPSQEAEFIAVLRNVIADALGPVREDLAAIHRSLGVTNGQSRSLSGRVTDLEGRVDELELATSDTEPPHGH